MGDTTTKTDPTANQAPAKKELTNADAAKMVRRPVTTVVTDKEGNPVKDDQGNVKTETKHVPVAEKEVLAFKDYGDGHVVVVTKDGKKFSSKGDE